jgi:hypothetical protein
LKTLDDVRRLLARTINEVRRGDLDATVASKIGYLANILAGTIKDSQLEEIAARVAQLEEQLGA